MKKAWHVPEPNPQKWRQLSEREIGIADEDVAWTSEYGYRNVWPLKIEELVKQVQAESCTKRVN